MTWTGIQRLNGGGFVCSTDDIVASTSEAVLIDVCRSCFDVCLFRPDIVAFTSVDIESIYDTLWQ